MMVQVYQAWVIARQEWSCCASSQLSEVVHSCCCCCLDDLRVSMEVWRWPRSWSESGSRKSRAAARLGQLLMSPVSAATLSDGALRRCHIVCDWGWTDDSRRLLRLWSHLWLVAGWSSDEFGLGLTRTKQTLRLCIVTLIYGLFTFIRFFFI